MSIRELTSFIYHRDGRACRYCGRVLRRSEATVDHYLARALGGGNEQDNLRLCCWPCNHEKADMAVEEWESVLRAKRAAPVVQAPRVLSRIEMVARCAPLWRERT